MAWSGNFGRPLPRCNFASGTLMLPDHFLHPGGNGDSCSGPPPLRQPHGDIGEQSHGNSGASADCRRSTSIGRPPMHNMQIRSRRSAKRNRVRLVRSNFSHLGWLFTVAAACVAIASRSPDPLRCCSIANRPRSKPPDDIDGEVVNFSVSYAVARLIALTPFSREEFSCSWR